MLVRNNLKKRCDMDIKKCYQQFGGDYEDASLRLMNDERIERFLRKFIELDDCSAMLAALDAKDYKTAFLKAHDLKGTSSNMGFTSLYQTSVELCEALRDGQPKGDVAGLAQQAKTDFDAIVKAFGENGG